MRGQEALFFNTLKNNGITPADAGTRGRLLHARCPQTDHPRGCGDKSAGMVRSIGGYGSPPRMRGQVQNLRNKLSGCRITPADAGTSCATEGNEKREKDHPRGCGDKRQRHCYVLSPVGSPPRMRGQALLGYNLLLVIGITPADAGTSLLSFFHSCYSWDHPRGCGDKLSTRSLSAFPEGSPPRMRGQGWDGCVGFHSAGITPADAGTS